MSESTEMYLETILVLHLRNGDVHATDIAKEMGFSKPTISQQMKRLVKAGYVSIDGNNVISLTNPGMKIATDIYARHNKLSEIFEYIGISKEQAVADACRIEHYISSETFEALKAYFDPKMHKENED
jgi:Mn-dependent DtxR family transcriptional regulator